MAEEQRCQEGHRLCANNCGFFGSPATNDLCSKCYRDLRLKEHNASSAMIAVKNSLSTTTTSSSSSVADVILSPPQHQSSSSSSAEAAVAVAVAGVVVVVRRCGECRKKVGLTTGFRCRCGTTYCGAHRYPESHACGFDFKSAGREAIARANPVVKADKLTHKI